MERITVVAWLLAACLVLAVSVGVHLVPRGGCASPPSSSDPAAPDQLPSIEEEDLSGTVPGKSSPAVLPPVATAPALAVRAVPLLGPPGTLADPHARAKRVIQLNDRHAADRAVVEGLAAVQGWPVRSEQGERARQVMAIRNGKVYEYITMNANAAISSAAAQIRNTPPYDLSGDGVTVGIWDAGSVRPTHRELTGRVDIIDGTAEHDHSTHVGGTVAAAGITSAARGMAPSVLINSHDWSRDTAEMTTYGMVVEGEAGKIQLSNHSYGFVNGWDRTSFPFRWYGTWGPGVRESDNFGMYDQFAAEWDRVCYEVPYLLPFKSAGNDRSDGAPLNGSPFEYWDGEWVFASYNPAVHPYADNYDNGGFDTIDIAANAKNIITVGSVGDAVSGGQRSVASANIAGYSGWGPTDDGRIKPDIMANGEVVYSCSSAGDSSYVNKSGTSMSAPNAAGSAALLVEYFGRLFPGQAMRNSSIKGLLIHTADDLDNTGPDYRTGWGLINVRAAADLLSQHYEFPEARGLGEGELGPTNGIDSFGFEKADSEPVKVTLCWSDPPADPLSGLDNPSPRLVHDLDLRVIDPAGATNYPFVLVPTNPAAPAVRGDNCLDNVEQVLIPAPSLTGTYSVVISIDGAPLEVTQHYSVLVSGASAAPVIDHVPLENTSDTSGVYTVEAEITALDPLDTNDMYVVWQVHGGTNGFLTNALAHVTNNLYRGEITAYPRGTSISYYLSATTLNGLQALDPPAAPLERHYFEVSEPMSLLILGRPGAFGIVDPDYGLQIVPRGNTVHASASPTAEENGLQRYACEGWIGVGAVPSSGSSNNVSFTIDRYSALEWQWALQYGLRQTSNVPGILDTTTWWNADTMADTVVATTELRYSGTDYHFVEWTLEGMRQPDATNPAVNPAVGLYMDGPRTAIAVYLPTNEDADEDGLEDWWERTYFGDLDHEPLVDSDLDGYLNLEEFQDRSDPSDPGSVPEPPVIVHVVLDDPQTSPAPWTVRAVVTDNHAVSDVTLRWRRNGLAWRQEEMPATSEPDEYAFDIPAPGILDDTFEYGIQATDQAGYLVETGPYDFFVAYPVIELDPEALNARLLAGTSTNAVVSLANNGNTGLVWTSSAVSVGLFDDIEQGAGDWTHYGQNDVWHVTTNRSYSGMRSWYCGDFSTGRYLDDMEASLVSPAVRLGAPAELRFMHWANMELLNETHAWDGGVVELSVDGGNSYQAIEPVGGYPYKIVSNPASPFAPNRPCFAGNGGWEEAVFDLSAFKGREVVIRFLFGSDTFVDDEGWFIDDVKITPLTVNGGWLAHAPVNGMLPAGDSTNVLVTIDSDGLPTGLDDYLLLLFESNDPVTPARGVQAFLSVRTVPHCALTFAGQTSTNGEGFVTVSNTVYDADGEACDMELNYSLDGGMSWTPLYVRAAAARVGDVAVSNSTPPQLRGIAANDGVGPATNLVSCVWDTTNSPVVPTLDPDVLVSVRVWDGRYWSTAVTSSPFLVDNQAPAIPEPVDDPGWSWDTSAWYVVRDVRTTWGGTNLDAAGIGLRGFRVSLTNVLPGGAGDETFVEIPAPETNPPPSGARERVESTAWEDGTSWWVSVRAVDRYGNVGSRTSAGPFRIDTEAPDHVNAIVKVVTNSYGDYVIGTVITSSWSGFSDNLSGIAGYYAALSDNGGTTNGLATTSTWAELSGAVPDATNGFYVWAQDRAGLIGQAARRLVLALDPDTDYDRDGLTSGQEEISGTDASDVADALAFLSITREAGLPDAPVVLSWYSTTGRHYSLHSVYSILPLPVDWRPVADFQAVPGTGGLMSYTGQVDAAGAQTYRLTVTMP